MRAALYLTPPDLTGPDRPGDRLGPTSGGSIGSQGMGDPVHGLALPRPLRSSTRNTLAHGRVLCGIVVYLV